MYRYLALLIIALGLAMVPVMALAEDDPSVDQPEAVTVVEDTNTDEVDSPMQDAVPEAVENTNLENWEFVLGFITPFILSFFMNPRWKEWQKIAGLIGWCIITTAVGLALQDQLEAGDWFGSVFKVLATAITAYVGIAGPLGLNARWGNGKVETAPAVV